MNFSGNTNQIIWTNVVYVDPTGPVRYHHFCVPDTQTVDCRWESPTIALLLIAKSTWQLVNSCLLAGTNEQTSRRWYGDTAAGGHLTPSAPGTVNGFFSCHLIPRVSDATLRSPKVRSLFVTCLDNELLITLGRGSAFTAHAYETGTNGLPDKHFSNGTLFQLHAGQSFGNKGSCVGKWWVTLRKEKGWTQGIVGNMLHGWKIGGLEKNYLYSLFPRHSQIALKKLSTSYPFVQYLNTCMLWAKAKNHNTHTHSAF